MTDEGEPTDAPGQGRPAGPAAEAMTAEETIGDRPPPPNDPDAPANGVLEDEDDPPEPNEPG